MLCSILHYMSKPILPKVPALVNQVVNICSARAIIPDALVEELAQQRLHHLAFLCRLHVGEDLFDFAAVGGILGVQDGLKERGALGQEHICFFVVNVHLRLDLNSYSAWTSVNHEHGAADGQQC